MKSVPHNLRWSFSKLSLYEQCPMAFYLQYVEKAESSNNGFAEYGTLCHDLLEGWAKGELPAMALAEEYALRYDSAVVHAFPPFPKDMPQKYYDSGLQYFEDFDEQVFGIGTEFEILAVEEVFELDIGGYPFIGIADLVLRHIESGEIHVIDHKTKSMTSMQKELNTYRRQLYTYAAYVKQKFGVYPSKLRFNMVRAGTFIDEAFNAEDFEATMAWLISTIEEILFETQWLTAKPSYFCRYICSTLDACPNRDKILTPSPKKGA